MHVKEITCTVKEIGCFNLNCSYLSLVNSNIQVVNFTFKVD